MTHQTPGLIILTGSGETLPSSGTTHDFVAQRLPTNPHIVIPETPAGFEPNSDKVAGKIKTFLQRRLQNYKPKVTVVPARNRTQADDFDIISPLFSADEILVGPGSPTYAARHLRNSELVGAIAARHMMGASLFLSSAATLAFGRNTLPVYEIYKVGEDLHWKDGVDYFSAFGLNLTIIPHWNNTDGGADLDTSCCYIGRNRFDQLYDMLSLTTVVGLDEHTSLIIDPSESCCRVMGKSGVTLIKNRKEHYFKSGQHFPAHLLGDWFVPDRHPFVSAEIEQLVSDTAERTNQPALQPTPDIIELATQRQTARINKNWSQSDQLRDQIAALGWQIKDTKDGFELEPLA